MIHSIGGRATGRTLAALITGADVLAAYFGHLLGELTLNRLGRDFHLESLLPSQDLSR